MADAIIGIDNDPFVTETNISENGIVRALLVIRGGTTDLTDTSRVKFITIGKFGSTTGIAGQSTTSLQGAYNNSTEPEITTNSTSGAISLRNGAGANTVSVLDIQNSGGTITKSINGNGLISKRIAFVTTSATPTLNTDLVDIARLTGLTTNITDASINLTGAPNHGDMFCYEITDNGTARTLAFGTSFSNTGTLSLPTTTVISTLLRCLFQWNGATSKWEIVAVV
jgi:hypothetical protein